MRLPLRSSLIAAVIGFLPCMAKGGPPEIWFSPQSGSVEYMKLFEPDAPWQQAASYVKVFQLTPRRIRTDSDADLAKLFAWLNEHHIELAQSTGLIPPHPGFKHTEGVDGDQAAMAARIQRLGGRLAYVAADEPLWFGHGSHIPGAYQLSVAELAEGAAVSARAFQKVFPDVRIVEDEPISNFTDPGWMDDLGQFLAAFRKAYGQPMAAVRMDIAWWFPEPWKPRALAFAKYLHGIGEPVGVIYDGNSKDSSDAEWLGNAQKNYTAYETLVGSAPDEVIFQSWVPHPTHLLPESSSEAFTHLILQYESGRQVIGAGAAR